MREHLRRLFRQCSAELEAVVPFLYIDVAGLITCGIGNLVNTPEAALRLEWMMGDRRASIVEVRDDWNAMNERREQLKNTFWPNQSPYTNIRLSFDTIDAIVMWQLDANIAYMRRFFPRYDSWPSDAQFGTNLLAWGLGAGINKKRPDFVRYANEGNWEAAKPHSHLNEQGNKGVIPRNARMRLCFDNAAMVVKRGLDVAPLWWPNKTPAEDDLRKVAVKAVELGLGRRDDENT